MCALFGWLDYKGIIPKKILKKLTQALANAAEERGTDAAGISYIKDGKVTVYKRPRAAHLIRFNAPDNTKAIMGHTRMATQGDKKHNYNNHPFSCVAGDTAFAFAHNGVLWNDKDLRKKGLIPESHIETDSYVACQLIEQQGKLDFESLKYMAETVEGDILKIDETGCISRAEFEYITASSHFGWYNSADYYPIHEELLHQKQNQKNLNLSLLLLFTSKPGNIELVIIPIIRRI